MAACRACQSNIEPFIDFGRMPLANAFLTPDEFGGEFFFNLSAAYCPRCTLVQLVDQPGRERMFNDRYPFFSSSSVRMQDHFGSLAGDVMANLPPRDPFVVEIGSNDGTLLRHVADAGISHLGVEPSSSVATAAVARGVDTIGEFFDAGLARRIVAERGHAHAIVAANALSHIANLHAVVEGIEILLAPGGTCVIEDPYWGDVVAQTAFDQIYDEHASYFTLSSLSHLVEQHGLAVLDAARFDVHGGSMRYVIGRAGYVAGHDAARSRTAVGAASSSSFRSVSRSRRRGRLEVDGPAAAVQGRRQTRRGLRRDVEEHDDHQLVRHHSGPDRIHQRYDAGQAGNLQPRGAHTGAASRRLCFVLSRSGAAVLVEPRR